MLAVTARSVPCVTAILENDPTTVNESDSEGLTALHLAVMLADNCDDAEVLEGIREELGKHHVDINAVDRRGRTLAHIAALAGASDILQVHTYLPTYTHLSVRLLLTKAPRHRTHLSSRLLVC